MKPSQLASSLRRIATAIDNSKNPSRALVARDLKKIIAAVTRITEDELVKVFKRVFDHLDAGGLTPYNALGGGTLDELRKIGLEVYIQDDRSNYNVSVTFDGDSDICYTTPKSVPVDIKAAAKATAESINSSMASRL